MQRSVRSHKRGVITLLVIGICLACHEALAQGRGVQWLATPRWTAGTLGSRVEFQSVTAAAATPGGGLAVVDAKRSHVLLLDSAGKLEATIGRDGSGPGEFRGPAAIGVSGGTLWVSEPVTRRLSFFTLDGKLIRTVPLTHAGSTDAAMAVGSASGLLSNGVMVGDVPARILTESTGLGGDGRVAILWAASDGVFRDTLFTYRDGPSVLHAAPGFFSNYQPLKDGDIWKVDPGGRDVVLVERDVRQALARPEFTIVRITPTARARQRVTVAPIRLPRSVKDSIAGVAWARVRSVSHRLHLTEEGVRQALYLPDAFPPVTEMAVDANGAVWLRREDTGAAFVNWELISIEGSRLGKLRLPTGGKIVASAFPRVWVSELGHDDEPLIRQYELKR